MGFKTLLSIKVSFRNEITADLDNCTSKLCGNDAPSLAVVTRNCCTSPLVDS